MIRNRKKAALLALAAACALTLTACTGGTPATSLTFVTAAPGAAQATQAAVSAPAPTPDEPAAQAPANTPAATPVPTPDENTLALVGGVPVQRAEVEEIAANLTAGMMALLSGANEGDVQTSARALALEYAVQLAVMDRKADEMGVPMPEETELAAMRADCAAQWSAVVDYYMAISGVTSASTSQEREAGRASALATLREMGYDENTYFERAVREARREALQAMIVSAAEVTEADIQAAYEARVEQDALRYRGNAAYYELDMNYNGVASLYRPEGYRAVLQILLEVDNGLLQTYQELAWRLEERIELELEGSEAPSGEPVTQAQVDAAETAILESVRATVDEIRARFAAGTPFLELVDEYNVDPGMQLIENRENGYAVHPDSIAYPPALVRAAFSVKEAGGMSEAVADASGVRLVYYLRDIPAGGAALTDEVRVSLTESVLAEKEQEILAGTIMAWLEEASVVVTEAGEAYRAQ